MNEYYLIANNEQEGPFKLDALKDRAVAPRTKVWREGMDEWVEAQEIAELNDILKQLPPPIPLPVASPLLINAEIFKKKTPLFKSGAKITFANEISANFKLITVSFGIALLVIPFVFITRNGFDMYFLIKKWKDFYAITGYSENLSFAMSAVKNSLQAQSLVFHCENEQYGTTQGCLEQGLDVTLNKSMGYALLTFVSSTFLLVVGRYIKMSAKWVKQTATS